MNETGRRATQALFGRGSRYAGAQAIQLGSAILVIPVLTRLLDAAEYGEVVTALVVSRVLAMVVGLGLPAVVTLEYFRSVDGRDRSRQLLVAAAAASVTLACLAVGVYLLLTGSPNLATLVALWTTAPMATMLASQALLQAQNRIGWFVGLAAISALGGQALGLAAVSFLDVTASGYLVGLLIGYILAAGIGMSLNVRRRDLTFRRDTLREGLRLGIPTIPHSAALYVLALGDRLVLAGQMGEEAVGRYDVAYQVGALAIVALVAYNQAWAPIIYGAEEEERWETLAQTTDWVLRVSALVAVLIAILSPIALWVAAPPEYQPHELVVVTSIIAFSVVPYGLYLSRAHVVFQQRATAVLAVVTPVAAGLAIGACVVLVPLLGLVGAALATLLGYVLLAFLLSVAAGRRVRIQGPSRGTWFAISAAAAASGAVALLPATSDGWVVRMALAALLCATIALALWQARSRQIRRDEIEGTMPS